VRPQTLLASAAHSLSGSLPTGTARHWPSTPPLFEASHAWQVPWQAVSQQDAVGTETALARGRRVAFLAEGQQRAGHVGRRRSEPMSMRFRRAAPVPPLPDTPPAPPPIPPGRRAAALAADRAARAAGSAGAAALVPAPPPVTSRGMPVMSTDEHARPTTAVAASRASDTDFM
jgi:hypothetical protein